MAKSYAHLKVKPETKIQAMELVNKLNPSDWTAKTAEAWIVFEKEALILMDYLKDNPQVTDKELQEKILRIAWDYAHEIGMSPRHRECWSVTE